MISGPETQEDRLKPSVFIMIYHLMLIELVLLRILFETDLIMNNHENTYNFE